MNTIDVIREFFGWCSVINMGLLLLLAIIMVSLHDRFKTGLADYQYLLDSISNGSILFEA